MPNDNDSTESDHHTGKTPDIETAYSEGAVLDVGEGDPETVRDSLGELAGHRRGTYASVTVLLPTADLERVHLEMDQTEHDTIADVLPTGLSRWLVRFDERVEENQQVNVPVSADAWHRAKLKAATRYQLGKDPELAFADAMVEFAQPHYNWVPGDSTPNERPLTHRDLPIGREADEAEE